MPKKSQLQESGPEPSQQEPLPNLIATDQSETERLEDLRKKLFYFPPARKIRTKTVQVLTATAEKTTSVATLYSRYFGRRNFTDINLEKISYRVSTLEASLTAHQANTLVELIIERSILSRFRVLELRALLGTTTLALLDRTLPGAEQVISVRAAEPRPFGDRQSGFQDILREIIAGYGFRDSSKINFVSSVERFDETNYQGQVAIIHPDPENLKTTQGLSINNLLPRMLAVFSLVAVAGPPKMFPLEVYDLVPEYIKLDDLDRARVAIFKSQLGEDKARALGRDIKESLKVNTSDWVTDLKKYLQGILPVFGVLPDDIPKYLSDKPLKGKTLGSPLDYWKSCFTHSSVDPVNNYENLEQYGDSVLKGFFTIYLYKQIPTLNKRTATELHQQYMSKFRQPDYADRLDLGGRKHYRINPKNYNEYRKSKEDLFEAFTAALFQISDSVLSSGQGQRKVLKLLEYIFDDSKKYDWQDIVTRELSQPRTQLKQRIDKIYMREGHRVYEQGNTLLVEIFIKGHDAVPLLREYGIILQTNRITSYPFVGTDETRAVIEAYEEGLRYMDSIGMTEKRLTEIQEILRSVDPSVSDMRDQVLNAKSLLGLEALYFLTPTNVCETRLIGVQKGKGREHVPLAQIGTCNGVTSKREVMERWLKSVGA